MNTTSQTRVASQFQMRDRQLKFWISIALGTYCIAAGLIVAHLYCVHVQDATGIGVGFMALLGVLAWFVGSLSDYGKYRPFCRCRMSVFTVAYVVGLFAVGFNTAVFLVGAHLVYAVCHFLLTANYKSL